MKTTNVQSFGRNQWTQYDHEIVRFIILVNGDMSEQEEDISLKLHYRTCQTSENDTSSQKINAE